MLMQYMVWSFIYNVETCDVDTWYTVVFMTRVFGSAPYAAAKSESSAASASAKKLHKPPKEFFEVDRRTDEEKPVVYAMNLILFLTWIVCIWARWIAGSSKNSNKRLKDQNEDLSFKSLQFFIQKKSIGSIIYRWKIHCEFYDHELILSIYYNFWIQNLSF